MRAFDLNFARAARIFDPNFMRAERKLAHPRDKIPSGERVLRDDEIFKGGGILSDRAFNIGEILSGSGILNQVLCGGILNLMSRGGTRCGFFRWVLRELRAEASSLRLHRKFQSAVAATTAFSRSKFRGSSRAAQCREIRAQGQGG